MLAYSELTVEAKLYETLVDQVTRYLSANEAIFLHTPRQDFYKHEKMIVVTSPNGQQHIALKLQGSELNDQANLPGGEQSRIIIVLLDEERRRITECIFSKYPSGKVGNDFNQEVINDVNVVRNTLFYIDQPNPALFSLESIREMVEVLTNGIPNTDLTKICEQNYRARHRNIFEDRP